MIQSGLVVLLAGGALLVPLWACSRRLSPSAATLASTAGSAGPSPSSPAPSAATSAAAANSPAKLLPVRDARGQVGFLDAQFKLVVTPRFDDVGRTTEGLTPAKQGENWGFLGQSGQWAIPPGFASAAPFSEGLATAALREAGKLRFGFIDPTGRWVVPAHLDAAESFREGLARVRVNGVEQYLDHTGQVAFVTPGSASSEFHGGLTRIEQNGRFGYADSKGKVVIPPRFVEAADFSEGLAAAKLGARWGFIDAKGAFRIPPQFVDASFFSAGLARVALSDHDFSFINPQGKRFGKYLAASDFQNGFAAVLLAERWGFIDTQGTLVVEPKFEKFEGGFREGLVAVAEPGHDFGFIDAHGRYVITPRFTNAQEFSDGMARVEQRAGADGGTQFGYVDSRGAFVWGPFAAP